MPVTRGTLLGNHSPSRSHGALPRAAPPPLPQLSQSPRPLDSSAPQLVRHVAEQLRQDLAQMEERVYRQATERLREELAPTLADFRGDVLALKDELARSVADLWRGVQDAAASVEASDNAAKVHQLLAEAGDGIRPEPVPAPDNATLHAILDATRTDFVRLARGLRVRVEDAEAVGADGVAKARAEAQEARRNALEEATSLRQSLADMKCQCDEDMATQRELLADVQRQLEQERSDHRDALSAFGRLARQVEQCHKHLGHATDLDSAEAFVPAVEEAGSVFDRADALLSGNNCSPSRSSIEVPISPCAERYVGSSGGGDIAEARSHLKALAAELQRPSKPRWL